MFDHTVGSLGPISVVIPVRDESPEVLRDVLHTRPKHWEVIVVDDGSLTPSPHATIRFEQPRGYGAALKAGIQKAKHRYIATMDGDGQHTFRDIERLWDFMQYFPNNAMVIGDRRLKERQPRRWIGRKVLNTIAGLFAWRWISDLNSGARVFRRDVVMGYFPILCDQFSFTTSLTLSMLADGYEVDFLQIKVHQRKVGESRVKLWRDGWRTLRLICWLGLALRTRRLRRWWRGFRHGVILRVRGAASLRDLRCDCRVCYRSGDAQPLWE